MNSVLRQQILSITQVDKSAEFKMFLIIHSNHWIETFPNVEIALRIYLCMFVTNCSGEHSFSKLPNKELSKKYNGTRPFMLIDTFACGA